MTTLKQLMYRCTAAALVLAAPAAGFAQAPFPSKTVTIVVPYSAGGSIDAVARPLATKLQAMWGQPVIVDNRPGANGMLATQFVMKAPANGYTLLYHITGIIQNPLLYKNVSYDPLKDFTPLVQIGGQAMGLSVSSKSPITSLDKLISDAKSKGDVGHTYGSVGVGHTGQIWSELLTSESKFKAVHVPYKGSSPLYIDLVTQRVDWAFLSAADSVTRANDQSVRVLAVTGPERLKQLPDVPTLRELGHPGFEMMGWHGLFAPAGTPSAVATKLSNDIRTALADHELQKVLDMQVIRETRLGTQELAKVMRDDQARWAALIKRFNIQAD